MSSVVQCSRVQTRSSHSLSNNSYSLGRRLGRYVTHLSQVNAGRLRVYGSVLSVMEPHNLYLVFITGRQPHSTIHRRGPSLSGCCWSYLEQFTPARHYCVFVACLPVTLQDSSLHHFLSQPVTIYSARAVTLVISDTLIVHIACLLTYLHTLRSAATSSSTANNTATSSS